MSRGSWSAARALRASLALTPEGSPARVAIERELARIEAELEVFPVPAGACLRTAPLDASDRSLLLTLDA